MANFISVPSVHKNVYSVFERSTCVFSKLNFKILFSVLI